MNTPEYQVVIRNASPGDFSAIVAINRASEHFLSPLSLERLQVLHGQSSLHRVACIGGEVHAFLLAFREGSAYDSPNYGWFNGRYPRFLYIDRVVVDCAAHGRRLGTLLYEDLFAHARSAGVPRVTCEFDIDPPNPVSEGFHRKFGFGEVGRQRYGQPGKTVALQQLLL